MSTSNGSNPNSLYALEKSLFGHTLALRSAEAFATEEEEDPQSSDKAAVESQAFDWDEAIELDYDQEAEADAEAMNWQDFDDHLDNDRDDDYSASLSWDDSDNSDNFSQDLSWEEEDELTNDVQAFEVNDDGHNYGSAGYEDPLSYSNSLFALEQSVLGIGIPASTTMQFAVENEPEPEPAESQAFDWDEAIELSYDESAYPTAEAMANSFDWLPTDDSSYGFGIENEPPTYAVEAFEVEDDPETDLQSSGPNSQSYGFEASQNEPETDRTHSEFYPNHASGLAAHEPDFHESSDVWSDSPSREAHGFTAEPYDFADEELDQNQAYGMESNQNQAAIVPSPQPFLPQTSPLPAHPSEAIPVQATIANPPVAPSKSAAPSAEALDFDFDEFDRAPVSGQASDAEAFAADLEAILRGEKVYEPPVEPSQPSVVAQPPTPAQPAAVPERSQAQSLPKKQPSAHDIFDQMSMSYATAFDLGTFSLEQTFDEFDAILDGEDSVSLSYEEDESPANAVISSASHNHEAGAIAQSLEWDEDEIAADVAALSADDWQALQFDFTDTEDETSVTHYPQAMGSPKQKSAKPPKTAGAATPTITGAELKRRYWHQISRGGTESNPNEVSGYYWSGSTNQEPSQFKKIGTPTKPDQFGVYQQYIQHSSGVVKKEPSTFFPDAWEEKHFDALFDLASQQSGFKPELDSKLTILGALAGDEQYKGMQIFFMPSKKGGGHCIPNYLLKKDPGVKEHLKTQRPGRNPVTTPETPSTIPEPPATTPEQPPLSQEASIAPMQEDDFGSFDPEMYNALEVDDQLMGTTLTFTDIDSTSFQQDLNEFVLELAGTSWEILEIDDENEEVETKKKPSK